jgi:hypothetical protein
MTEYELTSTRDKKRYKHILNIKTGPLNDKIDISNYPIDKSCSECVLVGIYRRLNEKSLRKNKDLESITIKLHTEELK